MSGSTEQRPPRLRGLRSALGPGRLRRQAAGTASTSLVLAALGVLTGPLLSRSLGPSGRGDVAAVAGGAAVLSNVLVLGLPTASAYFSVGGRRGTLFANAALFSVLVNAAVALALIPILPLYLSGHSAQALHTAWLFLLLLPAGVLPAVVLDIMRMNGAGRRWNLLRAVPTVLNAATVLTLFLLGHLDVRTALLSVLGSNTVAVAMLLLQARSFGAWRPRRDVASRQFRYALRLAPTGLADNTVARLDQVVLAAAVPSGQLGLYAVAVTVAGLTAPLSSAVALAAFPAIRSGRHREQVARRARAATLLLSAAGAVVLAVAGPLLIPLVFGSAFRGSITPLLILLVGQVAYDFGSTLSAELLARGHPAGVSRVTFVCAVLTIVGLALLVGPLGIQGAAATSSLVYGARALLLSRLLRRTRGSGSAAPVVVPTDHAPGAAPDAPPPSALTDGFIVGPAQDGPGAYRGEGESD